MSTHTTHDSALAQLVITAASAAFGRGQHEGAFHSSLYKLAAIESDPVSPRRVSTLVEALLRSGVSSLYERGWQPNDIAHAVKRQWTLRASRLAVAVIAGEARDADAVHRAPQRWLTQLDDLGAFDSVRFTIVGGNNQALVAWARSEKLDPDEMLAIALQVLAQLMTSSPQALLIEPPSSWGASNRGIVSPPSSSLADIDTKALKLIRALLAKAEATTFPAEAEAFTAKAQEMMTRYSIDAAVLASAARLAGAGLESGVEAQRVHIDNPYADEKALLLSILAEVNGARSVWSPHAGSATVMGYPVDLRLTDLLFTSLLVQATHASAEATSANRRLRTPSFRRAFLIAYSERIGERLEAAKQHVAATAEEQYGSQLLPILASREAAIAQSFTKTFPDVVMGPMRRVNAYGYQAGRAAAERAHIGAGKPIGPA